jgi:hypothetical protein
MKKQTGVVSVCKVERSWVGEKKLDPMLIGIVCREEDTFSSLACIAPNITVFGQGRGSSRVL